ncbi:AN1-type zinc finger protein 4-like [Watersipora subatra]|uniref:AN1-type zinc finger protein 4-like n=1 Tax=Watersipora subatra TaxID=2589382 RepID=UPI00355C1768
MMDLFIETLTGAAFELRVSPFESIQAVKMKIQRLEGIPISQQHLIWQTAELDNDYCLHDYDIHNGATLKLVLAMRGGPINTRRVPIEDSPLVEYMESTPDDLSEKLPGSSRQVTLLVFREGDQLNFFRVVDRGDGTLTPLSESLSAASMYNMYDDEDEGENSSKEKSEENARFKEKVNSLKNKMVNLSVSKKTKTDLVLSSPGSNGLQSLHSAQNKPPSALNKNPCLPPVMSQKSVPLTSQTLFSPEHDYAKPRGQLLQQTDTPSLSQLSIPKPPSQPRTAAHGLSQRLHHQAGLLTQPESGADVAASGYTKPYSAGQKLRNAESEANFASLKKSDSAIKSIPEDGLLASHNSQTRGSASRVRRKDILSLDKMKDSYKSPVSGTDAVVAVGGSQSGSNVPPVFARNLSSQQLGPRTASRPQADLTLESIKDSLCYPQRITLESLSSNEARMMSGFLQQASLEKLGSSSISNFSPVRTRVSNAYHTVDDAASENPARSAADTLDGLSSSAKLPPVKSKKKGSKSSKRCFLCTKKTGLATSYLCRCGQNFCAAHRYAESHECTFDYKTEGRQLLEQNNPVVSAPKLPKI